MHDDEVEISLDVVRELIADQFPQWESLPVRRVASSETVNAIFGIGDDLAARFPLRVADLLATRATLEDEARASTEFARHSPFRAPIPVAIGQPGPRYPLAWSVQTWLPGTTASEEDPSESIECARDLAALIAALRKADTSGRTFAGEGRGGDLRAHDEWIELYIRNSAAMFDASLLEEMWSYFRELPRTSSDVMCHGDLTPGNVLVERGRLSGVLDTGSFAPADPALDVIAGWHLLADGPRSVLRHELDCDDVEWERARAWAFQQALGAVWYYADTNPAMHEMGDRTLRRIIAHHSL